MTYLSEKWEISDRRIKVLCSEGRIEGATKSSRSWSIPENAVKPIDEMKVKIDSFRPLSANITKSLHDKLVVEWTYNSNAIERNRQ